MDKEELEGDQMTCEKNMARHAGTRRAQCTSTTKLVNFNPLAAALATSLALVAALYAAAQLAWAAIDAFEYALKWVLVNVGSNPFGWVM